jgi:hypothetical protein
MSEMRVEEWWEAGYGWCGKRKGGGWGEQIKSCAEIGGGVMISLHSTD